MSGDLHHALAHHLWLRDQLLAQCPELAEDEETLAGTLEGLSELDQALAAVVRSLEADEALLAGCAARMVELKERAARFEHRIETKRRVLAEVMERAALPKIAAPDFTLSLTHVKPKVVITDEAAIPADYLVQPEPPAPRPDKKLLAQALTDGFEIPGVMLGNGSISVSLRRK